MPAYIKFDSLTYKEKIDVLKRSLNILFFLKKKKSQKCCDIGLESVEVLAPGHRPLILRNTFFFNSQFPQIPILVVKMYHQ